MFIISSAKFIHMTRKVFMSKKIITGLMTAVAAVSFFMATEVKGEDMAIKDGSKVAFDYTLTVDGEVVDTSKGREPLEYIHGQGQIIPGLAAELEGMKAGEEKSVEIPPKEAYGEINSPACREVPKPSLPEGIEPQVGMYLQLSGPGGQAIPAKITEIKDEAIVIDLNHPLAGKTLHFDVVVVSVE